MFWQLGPNGEVRIQVISVSFAESETKVHDLVLFIQTLIGFPVWIDRKVINFTSQKVKKSNLLSLFWVISVSLAESGKVICCFSLSLKNLACVSLSFTSLPFLLFLRELGTQKKEASFHFTLNLTFYLLFYTLLCFQLWILIGTNSVNFHGKHWKGGDSCETEKLF